MSDIRNAIAFYTEALGLDLMTRYADQAAFFSSNGYHHHLGANTWHSRGAAASARDRAGLDRIVFRVSAPSELEEARARLEAGGHGAKTADGQLVVADPDGIELVFEAEA